MGTHEQPPEWIAKSVQRVTQYYQANAARNPFSAAPDQGPPSFDGMIPSSRPNNPPYHVVVTLNPPQSSCTCLAFVKYNRGADCSHIRLVKGALST